MQVQWQDKNVELNVLRNAVEQFLTERALDVTTEELSNGYKVVGRSRKILNVQLEIEVSITGTSNDFLVDLTIDKRKSEFYTLSRIAGALAWLIGGGVLVLKEQKTLENLEKIEHEFWEFMEKKVTDAQGSGIKPSNLSE